jgi:dihydroneopterin aldolase
MDIIFLRGLHIETIVGIFDWERVKRRIVVLDLEMATDNRKAAASDAIGDALDYSAVSRRIVSFVEQSNFFLVETLAERICEIIRTEFKVPWVRLTLNKKGAIQNASDVGIIIERGDKPGLGEQIRWHG